MAPNFPPWRRRVPQPKLGLDVITTNISQNPICSHGPTICFERFFVEGRSRKFYACSACRDQKECSFFLWADQQQPKASIKSWQQKMKDNKPVRSHQDEYLRLASLMQVTPDERGFCTVCNMLCILPTDPAHLPTARCNVTTVITPVQEHHLQHPSQLVPLKESSKCEAQYLFTERSLSAVQQMVAAVGASKVLCLGTPSLHEAIASLRSATPTSMLLDIDPRYRCFFPPTSFLRFNMCNQYFFDGNRAKLRLLKFLTGNQKVCIVCDPPFGARVELLRVTFSFLSSLWRQANNIAETDNSSLPVLLTFPYFMETQVVDNLPDFTMLDYKIDYSNHQSYTSGSKKAMKHGSAVRVYTNRPAKLFKLPVDEGYKYCQPCERWVYSSNVHCTVCNGCMGKDGSGYSHCDKCNKCVKPSWRHCDKCNRCQFQDHKCAAVPPVEFAEAQKLELSHICHTCGKTGHKRRDCPVRKVEAHNSESSSRKKRKSNKKSLPTSSQDENAQYMSVISDILCK